MTAQCEILLDWVGVTFHGEKKAEEIQKLFAPIEKWEEQAHGTKGYRRSSRWGDVVVSWEGSAGIHVDLSSSALRQIEALGPTDWQEVFKTWQELGARFGRLDVAFDERSGVLNMEVIEKHLEEGALTTDARIWEPRGKRLIGPGSKPMGRTFEIGVRTSDSFCRIYDKAAERKIEGHWVRCEMEWKRDNAQAAATLYVHQGAGVFCRLLSKYLDFKTIEGSSRVERRETADWWKCFLGAVAKLRLGNCAAVKSLQRIVEWFSQSMTPTLALVLFALEGDYNRLLELVASGRDRLNKRQRALVAPYMPGAYLQMEICPG